MKKKITLLSLLMALFLLPINGFAYTINNEFNLGANEGSPIRANPNYIIAQYCIPFVDQITDLTKRVSALEGQ